MTTRFSKAESDEKERIPGSYSHVLHKSRRKQNGTGEKKDIIQLCIVMI